MEENKEILKIDLIDKVYFIKLDDIVNVIILNSSIKVAEIVLNDTLTFDEKFNYLKSQLLIDYDASIGALIRFAKGLKFYSVFLELEILNNRGIKEAKKIYDALANDRDIKNEKEKLKEWV